MYAWLWQHLPGPAPVRAVTMAVVLAGALAVLFLVVFPAVRPASSFTDGNDPLGPDSEQVVEPDGVRSSPLPQPEPVEPSPVIPEDRSVPQQ